MKFHDQTNTSAIQTLNMEEIDEIAGGVPLVFIGIGIGLVGAFGGGMAFGYSVGRNLQAH